MEMASCFFCAASASLGPFDGISVCEGCTKRIGALALSNPAPIWSVADSAPMTFLPRTEADTKRALGEFEGIRVAPELSLARRVDVIAAFTAKGFYHLAVRDSSRVLIYGDHREKQAVLTMLLASPLLKPEGLDVLKRLLSRPDSSSPQ